VEGKAFAMWRGYRSSFRRGVVGLLMLAMLLAYAAPGYACPNPDHGTVPLHTTASASPCGETHAAHAAGHHRTPCQESSKAPAKDTANDACCGMEHCTALQSVLPVVGTASFVPPPAASVHPIALATPEGIGIDPALRPPALNL